MSKYYAVAVGKNTGIFTTWKETEQLVKGYPGAKHKSFPTRQLAESYLQSNLISNNVDTNPFEDSKCEDITSSHDEKESEKGIGSDLSVSEELSFRENNYDEIIYTDGSSKNGKGGYGIVRISPNNEVTTMKGHLPCNLYPKATNNQSELYAILTALNETKEYSKVLIYSDSMYCINSLTKWWYSWKLNGWQTSTGKDVLNKELIESILSLMSTQNRTVEFKHVLGHSGNPNNELADRLANEGRLDNDNS